MALSLSHVKWKNCFFLIIIVDALREFFYCLKVITVTSFLCVCYHDYSVVMVTVHHVSSSVTELWDVVTTSAPVGATEVSYHFS